MTVSSPQLSRRWWTGVRPKTLRNRELDAALEEFERAQKEYERKPDAATSKALADCATELARAAAHVAKACDARQDKDLIKALQGFAKLAEERLRAMQADDARRTKAAAAPRPSPPEEDEEEPSVDVGKLRSLMCQLPKTPMHFACGVGEDGAVQFILDRRKTGAALAMMLRELTGCRKAAFGVAAAQGRELALEVEKPLTGLSKLASRFLKDNRMPYSHVRVSRDVEEGEDVAAGATSGGVESPASAQGGRQGAAPVPAAESEASAAAATAGRDEPAAEAPTAAAGVMELSGSVGKGGRNAAADVQAVQAALNARMGAGLDVDGRCGPKTIAAIVEFQKRLGQFVPDGLVEVGRGTARALAASGSMGSAPEPPKTAAPPKLGKASLKSAPRVWRSTRDVLDTNIQALMKGVRSHYASESPALVKQIDESMGQLRVVLDKLDTRLSDALDRANAASGDAARAAELVKAKTILAEYAQYVKSEPLIRHMDSNPFGVKTSLQKVLTDSLRNVAQAIG